MNYNIRRVDARYFIENDKFMDLLNAYYDEAAIDGMPPLKPDVNTYVQMSDAGLLDTVILTLDDEIVGFVLVGVSYFSDDIGMIYELAIDKEMRNEELERLLVNLFKKWSADKGLSRLYILLHSQWNLSIETCREMGFKIPGYFMEKRLV